MTAQHNRLKDVFIYKDPQEIARAMAGIFVELSLRETGRKGFFTFVLSGGSTPEVFYRLLASGEFRGKVPWDKVHLFWGDERCVPPDDPASNYLMAYKAMISNAAIPAGNIHRMRGELTPREAALDYEDTIRAFFMERPGYGTGLPAFDFILFGLGTDGHTLSLFPGTRALSEKKRLVVENYVEKLKAYRLTMTLPLVNNASEGFFLVSGGEKSGILNEALAGPKVTPCPAQMIRLKGRLRWMTDIEAARLL